LEHNAKIRLHIYFELELRAGIENFRWHDLRHTWATRHAVEGTPLQALKKLGGWASWKSMERYIHLCVKDVEEYAENVEIAKCI
jgi:site-specific recombinase XerD